MSYNPGGRIASGMLGVTKNQEVLSVDDTSISVTKDRKPDRTLGYILLALGAVGVIVGEAGKR